MERNENNPEENDPVPVNTTMSLCRVSGKITNEGMKVGFMYREEPDDSSDSGWRFLSGTETQKYINDDQNSLITHLNLMIKLDAAIIPYLDRPFGTDLERIKGTDNFQVIS